MAEFGNLMMMMISGALHTSLLLLATSDCDAYACMVYHSPPQANSGGNNCSGMRNLQHSRASNEPLQQHSSRSTQCSVCCGQTSYRQNTDPVTLSIHQLQTIM
jgi:hypothetical protein